MKYEILLADACENTKDVLKEQLTGMGELIFYQIKTGKEFFSTLRRKNIALILLDTSFANAKGLLLLKILKKRSKWCFVPVVMLSNDDQDENIEKALRLGACDYFIKPLLRKQFFAIKIRNMLAAMATALPVCGEQRPFALDSKTWRGQEGRIYMELKESEERYRSLVNQSSDGVYIFDPFQGTIEEANQQFASILGYKADELQRLTITNFIDDTREEVYKKINLVVEQGYLYLGPRRYLRKDGTGVDVEVTASLVRYQDKRVIMANVRDTSERQVFEERWRAANEAMSSRVRENDRLRKIIDCCPAGIVVVDPKGRIEAMNQYLRKAFIGKLEGGIIGKWYFDVIAEIGMSREDLSIYWGLQGKATRGRCFTRGSQEWRADVIPIVENGQLQGAIGVFQNITIERQRVRRQREALDHFEKLFADSHLAKAIVNVGNGRFYQVNKAWCGLYNDSGLEATSKTPVEAGIIAAADHETMLAHLAKQFKEAPGKVEYVISTKNGEQKEIAGTFDSFIINGVPHLLYSVTDMTHIRLNERAMARLENLNLIGEMAASIGHEIRNPLTTVRGYLQFLSNKPEQEKYKNHYELMCEELDRANGIITEFLSLAGNKRVSKSMYDLNQIIHSVLPLLAADAIMTDKEIVTQLEEKLPLLLLDDKEIRQLILNLVRNGIESMERHGVLTIRTGIKGDKVILAIKDQGHGIPAAVMQRLGTPFVTTKARGTGLGLSVCYRVAQRHDACIQVDTSPRGTTFTIIFNMTF